ncbi:MAG: hypothetical protein HOI70_07695 [Opitutae bacterium]|nr:hypothetical protein [Opitutae bacterium]
MSKHRLGDRPGRWTGVQITQHIRSEHGFVNRAGSHPCIQCIGDGGKGSVGSHFLEGSHPVAKPDPQVNVGISLEDRRIDRSHSGDCGVAEENRVIAPVDCGRDVSGRLGTGRAGIVVAPVGDVGVRIDEGELELPGPVVGLPARGDLSGVGYEGGSILSIHCRKAQSKNKDKII